MNSEKVSHKSFDRAFAGVATAAVIAAIVAGFWVLGTPGRQREIAADRQRVQDLAAIAQHLHDRYNQAGSNSFELPATLEATALGSDIRSDPLTNQPYEYERLGDRTYELCATFDTDSSTQRLSNPVVAPETERWQHPEGRHCFEFDVTEFPMMMY